MDFSFNPADLITPAGIVVAGAIVRQVVEIVKNLWSWLDNGRERTASVVLAALLYVYWYAAFGSAVTNGVWLAVTAFIAVVTASIGINEAVDAGQATLARVVVKAEPTETGQPVDVEEPPEATDLVDEDEPVTPAPTSTTTSTTTPTP